MKINIKLVDANYDKETGISTATIKTDLGEFTGTASLHPDDAETASSYAGCRYAEMRATIKYLKTKSKIIDYKLEPLYKIYKDLMQRNNCNKNNIGIRVLEKEIYTLEDEKQFIKNGIKTLIENLNKAINSRDNVLEYIFKKEKRQ